MEAMTSKRACLLTAVAAAGGVLLFFARCLVCDVQFFHSDAHALLYPSHELMATQMRAGGLALWDPYSLCGYPLQASYVSAAFLPEKLLYCLLPFAFAFKLQIVLKHAFAAAFTVLLGRTLGWTSLASATAGLVFALAGPLLSLSDLHAFSPECLPLVLWLAARVSCRLRDGGRATALRAWALLVLGLTWSFLHGDLQTFYLGAILLLVFPWVLAARRGRGEHRAVLGATGWIALAHPAALLVGAAQLLPSIELLSMSTRGNMATSERLLHSLDPGRLAGLVWPDPLEASLRSDFVAFPYLGLAAAAVIFLALRPALRARPFRPLVMYFGVSAAALLLLALGSHFPLLEPLSRVMPAMSLFRYPQKWLLGLAFAFAGLLGTSLSALGAGGRGSLPAISARRPRWLCPTLAVITTLDVAAFGQLFLQERLVDQSAYEATPLASIGEVVPGYSTHDRVLRLPTNGALASPALERRYAQEPTSAAERRQLRTAAIAWNVATLLGNNGSRVGARRVSGISSFSYQRLERLLELAAQRGKLPRILDVLGAKWVLTTPSDRDGFATRPGLQGLVGDGSAVGRWSLPQGDLELYPRPDALDRAFWCPDAVAVAGDDPAAALLLGEAFDPSTTVVLSAGDSGGPPLAPSPPHPVAERARVVWKEDGLEALTLEVQASQPGYLVVSDSYDRGWKAFVDGAPSPLLRANITGRAVRVPSGCHEVEMRYAPASLAIGSAISLLALLALVAALIFVGRSPSPSGAARRVDLSAMDPTIEDHARSEDSPCVVRARVGPLSFAPLADTGAPLGSDGGCAMR